MVDAPGSEIVGSDPSSTRRRFRRRRNRPRRPRWLRNLIRISAGLLVVVVALAGAEVAFVAFRLHQIHVVNVPQITPPATSGPNVGAQTFLLIGSTSRCVLDNKQTAAFGSCAAGITGVNSDVILLLRADQRTHSVSVLSIPRDLVMNNVRPGGFYKIDAALADGPGQLVAAIEQNFGIPINHFVELNFDSFQSIVNALGGIKMDFPYRVRDDSSGLHIRTTGCVYLNGFNALALVRARNYWYFKDGQWADDGSGDLGRIIRVHEFLRVLATAVAKRGLSNPLTDDSLLSAIAPDLEIDSRLSLGDMVDLLRVFRSTNIATVPELTMPNIENFADYMYEGYDYGSVVLPSYPQDQQAIDEFLGLKVPPGAGVAPSSVTVSVSNGTGTAGQATTTAGQLSALGFHVVGTGSSTSVGPISETVVYYTKGHLLDAERLVGDLHGIVAMAEGPTQAGADVTVVTGSDFSTLSGQAAGTSATVAPVDARATTADLLADWTATKAELTSASTLGPPSPAVQPLPAYDPKACVTG